MSNYLPSLKLDMNNGAYLDTGIFFPFFYKEYPTIDIYRWANDICAIVSNNDIRTTIHIRNEIERAFFHVPLPKKGKIEARKIMRIILKKINIMNVPIHEIDPVLSKGDLSLHRRPDDMLLITSDKYLFERDSNAILIMWDRENGLSLVVK